MQDLRLTDGYTDVFQTAKNVTASLKERAFLVDSGAEFPKENLDCLKRSGLMGLIVPTEYGGRGAPYEILVEVAQTLSSGCLSTGMIWAMHCQQVAVLVDHTPDDLREDLLSSIVEKDQFIASVTSERGKGGDLLTAIAPLHYEGDDVLVEREAPVITGGEFADSYLITMRKNEESSRSEIVLVYAERDQLKIDRRLPWETMGMRGTYSVGLSLGGRLPRRQIIDCSDFKHIAVSTMIPVGHIAWAACWLGAAKEAFRQLLALCRNPKTRKGFNIKSDLFCDRLARIRLKIDTVDVYLKDVVSYYSNFKTKRMRGGYDYDFNYEYHIHINNIKILSSELLFEAVNEILQMSGLAYGYKKSSEFCFERTFRDLRSASLMFSNERLTTANGKLSLFGTI